MAGNLFQRQDFSGFAQHIRPQRGLAFGLIILTALLAFEIFNYSTTEFALADLLGDLEFMKVHWATILSIAFCGIDFAGIARLFTPELENNKPGEAWYLFGAWLLAATMNAMLTWWGVSLAVLNHQTLGNAVIERQTLLQVVPIFVAVMVWIIRVLIIGSFSVAGDRMFSQAEHVQPRQTHAQPRVPSNPATVHSFSHQNSLATGLFRPTKPQVKFSTCGSDRGRIKPPRTHIPLLIDEPVPACECIFRFARSSLQEFFSNPALVCNFSKSA